MTAPREPGEDGGHGRPDPSEPEVVLAKERTNLAWTRTAIAFAATGAAILKNHVVAGIVVFALALVTFGLRRVIPGVLDEQSRARRLLLVTITVTAVGIVALVVALTARSPGIR